MSLPPDFERSTSIPTALKKVAALMSLLLKELGALGHALPRVTFSPAIAESSS
jgi:hypothetical protein